MGADRKSLTAGRRLVRTSRSSTPGIVHTSFVCVHSFVVVGAKLARVAFVRFRESKQKHVRPIRSIHPRAAPVRTRLLTQTLHMRPNPDVIRGHPRASRTLHIAGAHRTRCIRNPSLARYALAARSAALGPGRV
ncbi:hypothetical protein BC628DRAFT_1393170, partial [Trametes gibbosa]